MKRQDDKIYILEIIESLLIYDPVTFQFFWKHPTKRRPIDRPAGYINNQGYHVIFLKSIGYRVHRLIWLMHYSELPNGDIDHIDGNRSNNHISNLRIASDSQNLANSRLSCKNKSGFKGVSVNKASSKPWRAAIQVNGRLMSLGNHETAEAASEAYKKAALLHFGEFAYAATKLDDRKKYG